MGVDLAPYIIQLVKRHQIENTVICEKSTSIVKVTMVTYLHCPWLWLLKYS